MIARPQSLLRILGTTAFLVLPFAGLATAQDAPVTQPEAAPSPLATENTEAPADPAVTAEPAPQAATAGETEADSAAARLAGEAGIAYGEGRLDDAILRFEEAFRWVPDPSFAYNMAAIHHELGHVVEAYNYYSLYLRLFPGAADRAQVEVVLAQLLPEVESTYALLDATTQPTGTEVFQRLDGAESFLGTAPFEWWVLPGQLTFVFRLEGYTEAETTSRSVPGLRITPSVELDRIVVTHVTPIEELAEARVIAAVEEADARATSSAVVTQTAIEALAVVGSEISVPSVSPDGANVWLDGEWIGQAPGRFDDLEPGAHQLEIRADGYHTYAQSITLEQGVSTGVADVTLEPYMIRMLVRSDTNETWLFAEGTRFGVLSDHDEAQVLETQWGPDYVMAYARHRQPYRIDLIGVAPGEDLSITLDMRRHWNERAIRTWTALASIGGAAAYWTLNGHELNGPAHDYFEPRIQAAAGGAAVMTMGMIIWGIIDRHDYYPPVEPATVE